MRGFAVLATLLVLPMLAAPTAAASDFVVESAHWGEGDDLVEAGPGDRAVPVTVSLQNVGITTWSGLRATLRASDHVIPRPGGDIAVRDGTLAKGEYWDVTFLVDVADDAPLGAPLALDVRMRAEHGDTDPETTSVDAEVVLTGHARPAVHASTTSLPDDTETLVDIVVTNEGTGAMGASTVTLASSSTLAVVGRDNVWHVAALDPGESATLQVPLLAQSKTTSSSSTATTTTSVEVQIMKATVDFTDAAGAASSQTLDLAFRVGGSSGVSPVKATLETPILTAGRTNELRFTVANGGATTLDGLTASVELPSATNPPFTALNASSAADLGDIAPGASATFRSSIIASSQASDTYAFTLTLAWTATDGIRQLWTADYGVLVTGNIDIRLTDARAAPSADGSSVAVSGTLTNVGNTQASNVYYRVVSGRNSTAATYLGDLTPNNPLPFTTNAAFAGATAAPGGFARNASGGFPARNATLPGAGAGGAGGSRQVANATAGAYALVLTWNDEYGNDRSLTLPVPLGAAAAGGRAAGAGRPAGLTPTGAGTNDAPALGALLTVAAAGGAVVLLGRRRA